MKRPQSTATCAVADVACRDSTEQEGVRREMFISVVENSSVIDGVLHLEMRPWFKSLLQINLEVVEGRAPENRLENWLPAMDSNHD